MKPQPRAASSAAMEPIDAEEGGAKRRKRLTADERLFKNRERNKSHARKTRERKKNHMAALRARVEQLEEESNSLRAKVDARYTANVLLGLGSGPEEGSDGADVTIRSSGSICRDLDKVAQEKQGELMSLQMRIEEDQNALLEMCTANVLNTTGTGIRNNQAPNGTLSASAAAVAERRAKGKYTPQERETIRRERNRIHAKKTRDKKKIFLESSEATIATLEKEVESLRAYLVGAKVMSADERAHLEARDQEAQLELTALKDTSNTVVTDVLLQIRGDNSVEMAADDNTTTGGSGSSHTGLIMSSRSSSSDISSGSSADAPTPTGTGSGSGSSVCNGGGAVLDSSSSSSSSNSRVGSSDVSSQHVDIFRHGQGTASSAGEAMMHSHSKGGDGSTTPPTDDDDTGISAFGVHNSSGHTSGSGCVITESASSSSGKRGQKRLWGYRDGDDHDNSNNSDNNEERSSGSTDGSHEGSSGSGKEAGKPLTKQASLQSLSVKHDASSDAKAAYFF